MSRNYSIRNFLRNAPNHLIAQYLESHNIKLNIDFSKLKETNIKQVFDAITAIEDDTQQKQIGSDFQAIFQMSIEGGIKQILKAARFAGVELEPIFEHMQGFYEKAFYTFMYHRDIFEASQRFACTDYLPGRYWRKIKNLKPFIKPDFSNKNNTLADAISTYFKKVDGRGKSCLVDYYPQGNLHYYFCYPEDYSKTELLWENGNFRRRNANHAFEVIFVYDADAESLDSFFDGDAKTDKALKGIFAREVLDIESLPDKETVTYNLEVLKIPNFQFKKPLNSKIKKVLIHGVRFVTDDRKIVVTENNPKESVQALLNDIARNNPALRLSSDSINQITIQVILEANNKKGQVSRTFSISYPGSCNLKYDENDLLIRQMIIDSGIEALPEKEAKVA